MERYVVFIRNNATGEEFVTSTLQIGSGHSLAVSSVQNKYPAPRYTVHTAYTVDELSKILSHVGNVCGPHTNNRMANIGALGRKTA